MLDTLIISEEDCWRAQTARLQQTTKKNIAVYQACMQRLSYRSKIYSNKLTDTIANQLQFFNLYEKTNTNTFKLSESLGEIALPSNEMMIHTC